jgi:hypothetical protein
VVDKSSQITDVDTIEISPAEAMAATRHLVLLDISRRLLLIEQRVDGCDTECDRALMEMWRLLRWVEGRVGRNLAN